MGVYHLMGLGLSPGTVIGPSPTWRTATGGTVPLTGSSSPAPGSGTSAGRGKRWAMCRPSCCLPRRRPSAATRGDWRGSTWTTDLPGGRGPPALTGIDKPKAGISERAEPFAGGGFSQGLRKPAPALDV